jgi:peptidoglycan/LPS O-acetylase OafA/YrhL
LANRLARYTSEHWHFLGKAGAYPGIDVLRAAAASLVVLFHCGFAPFRFGWIGVDLFFVVSGFLIGGAVRDALLAKHFRFSEFYRNRALRILPTYYLFIALTAMLKIAVLGEPSERGPLSLAASLLFLQMSMPFFLRVHLNNAYVVEGSWTLAIEEYFYLAAPLFLFLCYRRRSERKVLAVLGLCMLLGASLTGRLHQSHPRRKREHLLGELRPVSLTL